ncbi:MAG: hypothetical protein K8T90_05900 [Planctomycetes bacterium]|nr:hypothetical protein [Planctomycetota bacterium]
MAPLTVAMRLFDEAAYEAAANALAPLAGTSHDGVIARFRLAECLSRLGRHADAVDAARRAYTDATLTPATGVWFAQCLAEAGRYDDAAAVRLPEDQREFTGPVADGYAALAKLAANVAGLGTAEREAVADAILVSRHSPIYSLAIRLTERARLSAEPRWPDLPSWWYRHECVMEMEEDGVTRHASPPQLDGPSGFLGAFVRKSKVSGVLRWLRLHSACGDWSDTVRQLRDVEPKTDGLDEVELEMLLAVGSLDAADALATRLAEAAGKDASGELAIDRCRLAQLRGRAARPPEFAGFEDAKRRLGESIAWLELCAALVDGRDVEARTHADRVSDPSHREYVEAGLLRWCGGR